MDHKQLPGAACCPWLTSVIDDATRVLAGWAIALTPHTGTVLTAVRMALVHDPARGPFGAIPA
jgi:putative transposase